MDIKLYREHVKRLAALRSGEAVYNGSADHAAVIVENMFAAGHHTVRLLSGDLNAKVYGSQPVVDRARQFLGHSDHKLEVLVEHISFSSTHPLIEEIGGDDNVTFFHIPETLSEQISYHFMTADDDCFRFEREKNSHAAVAAFGDRQTAQHLIGIFDQIRTQSRKLDLSDLKG